MFRPSIREILDALDFARVQAMRRGSPDFLRQRVIEERVQALCTRLVRGPIRPLPTSPIRPSRNARHTLA